MNIFIFIFNFFFFCSSDNKAILAYKYSMQVTKVCLCVNALAQSYIRRLIVYTYWNVVCRNLLKEWHQIMVILTHLMSILFPLYINKPKNTCSSSQVCIIRLYYKYCNNFSAFTFNLYEGIVMACSCFNSLIFAIMSDVYWQI